MPALRMMPVVLAAAVTPVLGATATFSPPDAVVAAGDPAVFEVTVSVDNVTLSTFQTADLVLGWDQAGDLTFSYSSEFLDAMSAFVLDPPTYDSGAYTNDAFVGGASSTAVGASILLGTVALDTSGLAAGTYVVQINATRDGGVSNLGLAGESESVVGSGTVTVTGGSSDTNSNDNGDAGANDNSPGGDGPGGANDNAPEGPGTNDNASDEQGLDDPVDGGANDNIDSDTNDNGDAGSNDNGTAAGPSENTNSPHATARTPARGPCGFGIVGALPLGVAGVFLLHAHRRHWWK